MPRARLFSNAAAGPHHLATGRLVDLEGVLERLSGAPEPGRRHVVYREIEGRAARERNRESGS